MPRVGPKHQLLVPEIIEEASPVSGSVTDPDEHLFRRVGDTSPTSLPTFKRQQAVHVSRYLFQFNPDAHRLLELLRDFVVSGIGFEIEAEDDQVQEIVNDAWSSRFNRWDAEQVARYTLSLSVDGEVVLPVKVMKGNPVPLFGYVSTLQILGVEAHPFRPSSAKAVTLKGSKSSDKDVIMPVLGLQSIEEIAEMAPKKDGLIGCFYWSINQMPDDPRGVPDLFCVADDIDQYSRTNWARMRKQEQEGNYIWDVSIEGATKSVLQDWERELLLNPPRAGGYRVHNERVTWDTVQPPGGGTDASNEMRYHRSNISSSFGIPDFFVTGESGAGRMATAELWSTVIATAGSRQREMKTFIKDIINFIIDWGIINAALPEDVNREFRVTAPVIGIRDLQRMSGMLKNFTDTLLLMYENNILGDDSVKGTLRTLLTNLGFNLSDDADLERIPTPEDLMKREMKKQEQAAKIKEKHAPKPAPGAPPVNQAANNDEKSDKKAAKPKPKPGSKTSKNGTK